MANDQVRALAQELVDFIAGEPKRVEEEKAAKAKGGSGDAARKARLADEVAKKIAAIMPADEEAASAGHAAPAQHKS
jgi:hypothetical protein